MNILEEDTDDKAKEASLADVTKYLQELAPKMLNGNVTLLMAVQIGEEETFKTLASGNVNILGPLFCALSEMFTNTSEDEDEKEDAPEETKGMVKH